MTYYTIRPGDTLNKIALKNNLTLYQLLELNPRYRSNPNLIYPGDNLVLSDKNKDAKQQYAVTEQNSETAENSVSKAEKTQSPLPEKMAEGDKTTDKSSSENLCQETVQDVVHLTGEGGVFYALPSDAVTELHCEIDEVEALMQEFRDIVSGSSEGNSQTLKGHDRVAEAKKGWLEKARDNGLMCPIDGPPSTDTVTEEKTSADDKSGLIAGLKKERDIVKHFSPGLFHSNNWESNFGKLKAARLKIIDQELAALEGSKPAAATKAEDTKTNAQFMKKDYRLAEAQTQYQHGKSIKTSRTGFLVQEVTLLSKPDKFYYVRSGFIADVAKKRWAVGKVSVSAAVRQQMKEQTLGSKELAKALMGDIKQGIKDDWNKSKLETLEVKLWEWKAKDDCLFNSWHQELKYDSSKGANPGDTVMAVSAEAHALRFAASASAAVSSFNPEKLQMNMGAKFQSAASLLEGSVGANLYLPNDAGYNCFISYRNAEGDDVLHEFGAFRLNGSVTLSCFIGARVSAAGELEIDASGLKKSKETSSGASALMSPAVQVKSEPQQGVTVKGEAFAGADAGGSVAGALEWESPLARSNWKQLVEVKAEGAVAFGAGASGSFEVKFIRGKFELHIEGQLVFGPGAGGGFGTTVDLANLLELFELILDVLAEVDYRYLNIVDKDAFEFMSKGLYRMMVEGAANTIDDIFKDIDRTRKWWDQRSSDKTEAQSIASSVNQNSFSIQLDKLPPQTSGPLLYILAKTWIEVPSYQIESQESAIIKLLKPISSWRQFIEILEHMSEDGKKVNSFTSLEKLNSILDFSQQNEFNEWIQNLVHRQPGDGQQFNGGGGWGPFTAVAQDPKTANTKRNNVIASGQLICWNGDDLTPPGGGAYA